ICSVTNASSGAALGADVQLSLLAVTYSTILLLGLAGSALSLPLLSRRAKPLSRSYILLLQLALLDALFLCALPLHIHSQLLGDTWSFGDAACRVTGALSLLRGSLSVSLLGSLCGDLWLAALHPFASIQLRAAHYLLLAAALWLLALGGTVPLVLHSRDVRSCFGSFPGRWAAPPAPHTILASILGAALPCSITLLGLPLAARSVWRSGRGAARRKALGTISMVLGICALCFLPQQLGQLLQLLRGSRGPLGQPCPGAGPRLRAVTEALASCSCCLNPLLYRFHCSGGPWRCPFRLRLRLRAKRVFTICDQNFGDPSWDYRPGQSRGRKTHRDGIL
ncbi:GP183 protein, partial [Tichodroma muraria]|nr:GP183 protein [Tichodroma muraria]